MSDFKEKFTEIKANKIKSESKLRKSEGWRYVQTLAVKVDNGIDLIYSFMKDGCLENIKIKEVTNKNIIDSITEDYIEAFVWENEIHDLFGVKFKNIAIDFKGNFYNLAQSTPMSIVSPQAIERKQKQAKINQALAAKKAKESKNTEDKKEEK